MRQWASTRTRQRGPGAASSSQLQERGALQRAFDGDLHHVVGVVAVVRQRAAEAAQPRQQLEAIAIGLGEVVNEDYLEFRVGQVAHLGEMLDSFRLLAKLAPTKRHIIPGHDPHVMKEYEPPKPPRRYAAGASLGDP